MSQEQQQIFPYLQRLLNGAPVEWKPLGEVASYIRGITYSKSDEVERGGLKVLRANNITLENNRLNFDDIKEVNINVKVRENQQLNEGDILICAGSGSKEHIGKVAYIEEKLPYTFGGFMGVVRAKSDNITSKYIFYCLSSSLFSSYLQTSIKSSTINNLNSSIMNAFNIPIPPMGVQERIVEILDKFTELQAELQAELALREKQYIYFRDQLLSFEMLNRGGYSLNEIKYLPLGEVLTRTRGTKITAAEMKNLHTDGGSIKIFAGGKTTAFVNYGDIPDADVNTNASIIVKSRGIIEFEYYDKPFSHKNEFWAYNSSNNDNINLKYVYYLLKNNEEYFQGLGSRMQMPQISSKDTDNYVIPIPPMEEQERIVRILDRFETMVHSIKEGLPREIELRRKQYEYFRDQLLTFPKG